MQYYCKPKKCLFHGKQNFSSNTIGISWNEKHIAMGWVQFVTDNAVTVFGCFFFQLAQPALVGVLGKRPLLTETFSGTTFFLPFFHSFFLSFLLSLSLSFSYLFFLALKLLDKEKQLWVELRSLMVTVTNAWSEQNVWSVCRVRPPVEGRGVPRRERLSRWRGAPRPGTWTPSSHPHLLSALQQCTAGGGFWECCTPDHQIVFLIAFLAGKIQK